MDVVSHMREMTKLFRDEYRGKSFEDQMVINYRIMMIAFNIDYMKWLKGVK